MYNKILNPKTGRMVSINSITGKSIINKYLNYLNGGKKTRNRGSHSGCMCH